jgi:mono/diheme cytochrome c family protein
MERISRWYLLVVGVGALIAIVAWEILRGPVSIQVNPATVERGRTIYAENCASCHGVNLEGQANWQQPLTDGSYPAPPQDASGHTWMHSDTELFVMVRDGSDAGTSNLLSTMPGFGKTLSENDMLAALAFIKSQWPPDVLAAQARMNHEIGHHH